MNSPFSSNLLILLCQCCSSFLSLTSKLMSKIALNNFNHDPTIINIILKLSHIYLQNIYIAAIDEEVKLDTYINKNFLSSSFADSNYISSDLHEALEFQFVHGRYLRDRNSDDNLNLDFRLRVSKFYIYHC